MPPRSIRPSTGSTPHVLLVMGVSGAGKSTLGAEIAEALGWDFVDADDLHPRRNVEKMHHGIALTDADRRPWLAAVRACIAARLASGTGAVIACSALKHRYRRQLRQGDDRVRVVYLRASHRVLERRLQRRRGHYMSRHLLASQLATLEPPAAHERSVVVDVSYGSHASNLAAVLQRLRASS